MTTSDLGALFDLQDSRAFIEHALGIPKPADCSPQRLVPCADSMLEQVTDWMYLAALRGDFDSEESRLSIAAALHYQMHGYHFWPVTLPWPGTTTASPGDAGEPA